MSSFGPNHHAIGAWSRGSFHDTTQEDSFNMTSVTDNGTGDSTWTIANDMSNANYAFVCGRGRNVSNGSTSKAGGMIQADNQAAPAAGTCRFRGLDSEAGSRDFDIACTVFIGDIT